MDKRLIWITKYNAENNDEYKNFVFSGNYLAIYKPSHQKARKDGYVYIHQLQAEKKLNRNLKDGECVHHIDENKYNNDIDNLIVFKTIADHIGFHKGDQIHKENDVWVAEINTLATTSHGARMNKCPCCGKLKSFNANMCFDCHSKEKAKNIPSRENLERLIIELSMTKIGKLYNVSDNAVRKWCVKYGLPYKRKDIIKYYK